MNKLKMKAKAGVTLVELLVVILIVTILSVSMLPLLQPFVVEAQYAAEPIPVIGNLRTKIGLYQYNVGKLPCNVADASGVIQSPELETWMPVDSAGGQSVSVNPETADFYSMATVALPSDEPPLENLQYFDLAANATLKNQHFGKLCDLDFQELKGKRSRPNHYQYVVLENGTDYAYFLGCFGDGNGLKAGTGYAVCEIVSPSTGHKYVGTWKRYKPVGSTANQICFTSSTQLPDGDTDTRHTLGCYVPAAITDNDKADDGTGNMTIVSTLKTYGWEF